MKNKIGFIPLLAAMVVLSPVFSFGQNAKTPAHNKKEIPETMDDPYLPNAYNNQKVSPAYKYKSPAAPNVTSSSSIYTIQVNVNSSGQNILGDAANEPNIAMNPLNPNEIVIGWRQFDNVSSNFRQAGWAFTSDSGKTWNFPGRIEAGVFRSDPVLDFDNNGNFYYNSLTSSFNTKVFISSNGGASWNTGVAAGGGDKQWMAIDHTTGVGSGNIYSAWTYAYTTCAPGYFTRSTNGGNSFESCTEVDGAPFLGTEAIGNSGELYICGADTLDDSIVVSKSLNAETPASLITWNPPVKVFLDGYINESANINPAGLTGQANIDVDHSSGNVYVLASVARLSSSDPADVMFSKSTDGGLTWDLPTQINDDASTTNNQWLGTLSVAPNGRIDAVWLDTRNAPSGSDSSALYYSYSTDQGNTWSVNEKLSALFDPHVGYPNQSKMGDYFDMMSDNTGAHLAWTNTLNGEEDVYYSHIIPQIGTGVNEISGNAAFSIFPNPTSGEFAITMNNGAKRSQVEICNILGEKVFSTTLFNATSKLDISTQPAGIYFLKVLNQDGSAGVEKIIKK